MNPTVIVDDLLGRNPISEPLYNDRPAAIVRMREKPEHRIMVLLKAQGLSNTEIAEQMGVTQCTVSLVLRQPWARSRLLEIFSASGVDKVDKFLAGAAMDSLQTLVEIRDDKNAGAAVRKSAASDLLDRYLGKPVQKTANLNLNPEDISLDAVDRELAQLRAQEQVLLGRSVVTATN